MFNARGRLIAQGTNQASVSSSRAGTAFYVKIRPATDPPVSSYNLSISIKTRPASVHRSVPIANLNWHEPRHEARTR